MGSAAPPPAHRRLPLEVVDTADTRLPFVVVLIVVIAEVLILIGKAGLGCWPRGRLRFYVIIVGCSPPPLAASNDGGRRRRRR